MAWRWLIVLLLAGCKEPATAPLPVVKEVKTIEVAGGEITTVHVPVKSMGSVQETQTCFVWRDRVTQSSTMQCPNDRQSYSIDPP